ncbi:putative O-glycosylation ligase, exosortase A system-associated [Noviherbaspirillum massiliense]|uniref:putative O-glycosylation ligase, exosortase A system-associated n=1 Tax=Noviherbaspirillum massiliense TaxID=1465823 RepID=UPI0002D82ABC|nr:putative O-glycosylation ligase, exosortase A system-associated [Noviherbaspirillum massiliense]
MRDLMMLATLSFLLPSVLADGFVAYVLWAWSSAFSPNFYMYGFMASARINLLFAGIALGSILLNSKRSFLPLSTTQKLQLVFLVHASVCALLGYSTNPLNFDVYENLAKALIFCLVMPAFLDNRLRLHVLLIALAIGMGFHGLLEGAKFLASGGGHKVTGITTSMISDNNHFAVGQLMIIPVLFFLYQYSKKKLVRFGFLLAFALAAFSVMGTFSRGGFIGLSALGLWMVFSSRRKFLSFFAVAIVALTLFQFAPESWFHRVETINNAGEDESFMTRVIAWKVSTAIALSNPWFGGGFHAVQAPAIWSTFKETIGFLDFIPTPPPTEQVRAAHSIYFEVLGDTGFIGLGLFILIWANAWRTALSVKRLARNQPNLVWASDLSDILRVSLLVYAISGAAVSMGYFELFYIFSGIVAVLERHVMQALSSTQSVSSAESPQVLAMPSSVVAENPAQSKAGRRWHTNP